MTQLSIVETSNPVSQPKQTGWRTCTDFNILPEELSSISNGDYAERVSESTLEGFLQRMEQMPHLETRRILLRTAKESLVLQGYTPEQAEAMTVLVIKKQMDSITVPMPAFNRYLDALQNSILTGEDFLSLDIPERPLIVTPWLKMGTYALITAPRGIGKTNFILAMLTAITHGQPFDPWNVENPVPCLLIDGEMPLVELQDRYRRLSKDLPAPAYPLQILSAERMHLQGYTAPNLTNPDHRAAILDLLGNSEIKLAVFDNLSALCPGIDENSKEQYDAINQFFMSIRFLGIAVLVVHHAGKDKKISQRGTSGREDSVDFSIFLTRPHGYRESDGCRLMVQFTKTRGIHGADAASFIFQLADTEDGGLTWKTETVSVNVTGGLVKARVIRKLGEGYTQKEIAEELTIDKAQISRYTKKAIADGILEKGDGKGSYNFTDKGKKQYGNQSEEIDQCKTGVDS